MWTITSKATICQRASGAEPRTRLQRIRGRGLCRARAAVQSIRGAQPGDTSPRRYQEAREDLTTDYFWIFPNWMLKTAIPTMFR